MWEGGRALSLVSFFVSKIHPKDVAKTRGEQKALKALWVDTKSPQFSFFRDDKTLNCMLLSFDIPKKETTTTTFFMRAARPRRR